MRGAREELSLDSFERLGRIGIIVDQ